MINIGDRVIISHSPMAHATGKKATVVDRLYSEKENCNLFKVRIDEMRQPEITSYKESDLTVIDEPDEKDGLYRVTIELQDNLAVATLYNSRDGRQEVVAMGHGHIFHEGAVGVAQASSYACKKLFEQLNGGDLKLENKYLIKGE